MHPAVNNYDTCKTWNRVKQSVNFVCFIAIAKCKGFRNNFLKGTFSDHFELTFVDL